VSTPQLPKAWRLGCLNDVAAKVPNAIVDGPFGSNLKLSDYVSSGVPVLQGKNITNDRFRWFDVRFISEVKAEELKRSSVRVGDLLMVKIGSIGYSAVVDSLAGYDFAVIPANLAKITPDLNLVDREYLHHWLTSPEAKRYLLASASKTAQPALSLGKIKALPIPIPPLEEQRRIAAILDQAETLRTQRRQALAHLDTLTQSLFLDMFGDPTVEAPKWPKTQLDMVAELVTGYPFRSEEYVSLDEGIKLCRGANVLPGRLDWRDMACWPHAKAKEAEAFYLQAGDIVMAMDRPWISEGFKLAQVDAADCPMLLVQRVARIRPKSELTNEYLFAALSHLAFTRHCRPTETTIPHISPKDIRSYAFPLPPLPLQQTFATRIQAIETLKATHRTALAQLDALFTSLQLRAFAGEL
jgi:type I restriction enzyme S subunit